MPEKIKITKAEIAELYDVIDDDPEKQSFKVDNIQANATFEEFSQSYDEKEWKEMKEKEDG